MSDLAFSHVALGAANSNLTGAAWLVADFWQLTVSIQSSTGSASRYTVIGTNADGLRSALGTPSQTVPSAGWSIVTAITAQGLYGFDVLGYRWVSVFRDSISVSASSNVTMTFAART